MFVDNYLLLVIAVLVVWKMVCSKKEGFHDCDPYTDKHIFKRYPYIEYQHPWKPRDVKLHEGGQRIATSPPCKYNPYTDKHIYQKYPYIEYQPQWHKPDPRMYSVPKTPCTPEEPCEDNRNQGCNDDREYQTSSGCYTTPPVWERFDRIRY